MNIKIKNNHTINGIAFLKRYAFTWDLNVLKLSHEQMLSVGRLFLRSGAAALKALDPQDFRLKLMGFSCRVLDDWSVLGSE